MTLDPKLKAQDILPIAARAEIDAEDIYRTLFGRVKNEVLKQKLDFLAKEEGRHRAILTRLFADKFPGRPFVIPERAARPKTAVAVDDRTPVLDLFKLAMQKEKEAEDFYRSSKPRMEDQDSRRTLDYLSRVERSHFYMLKSEVDLLERFPEYFDVEDFHVGQDLFHVGP
jgi:rubrerythrin